MLSSFCCHELGYGFQPPKEVIDAVNKTCETQQYIDVDAALKKYGMSSKKNETSPFVRELEYGNSNDGYWKYEDMIEQLEDCVDVLKCMFPNLILFFFLTILMVTTVSNPTVYPSTK